MTSESADSDIRKKIRFSSKVFIKCTGEIGVLISTICRQSDSLRQSSLLKSRVCRHSESKSAQCRLCLLEANIAADSPPTLDFSNEDCRRLSADSDHKLSADSQTVCRLWILGAKIAADSDHKLSADSQTVCRH